MGRGVAGEKDAENPEKKRERSVESCASPAVSRFALFNYRYLNYCQHLAIFYESFHSPNIDCAAKGVRKTREAAGFSGRRVDGAGTLDSGLRPALSKALFLVNNLELSFLICKTG